MKVGTVESGVLRRESERWRDLLEWDPDVASRECTVARVQSIAFSPMDRRLRNELITRSYYDLATEMATLVGTDATWTTFGHWASHTIGSFLTLPVPFLGRIIARSFGYGNREVFADIGAAQALFLETVGKAAKDDSINLDDPVDPDRTVRVQDAFVEFTACLRKVLVVPPGTEAAAGTPFWETVEIADKHPEGQPRNHLLILGFQAYAKAIVADDDDERSKYLLMGNSLLALHEQRILALAISMGFRSWLRNLTRPWLMAGTQRKWLNTDPGSWRISLEDRWIRFATRHFVRVDVPWGPVPVGKPVPSGERPITVRSEKIAENNKANRRARMVEQLDADEFLHELHEEFVVDGRPASNWNILSDRMAYILALFAQHQRSDQWWNNGDPSQGLKVAPQWNKFDAKLAEQVERMKIDPSSNIREPSNSPMTDAELEKLRFEPSYPLLQRSATQILMRRAVDQETRDEMERVATDVRARMVELRAPGGLLDPDTVQGARRLFERNETLVFVGLFLRSLPDAYAAARGVQVISEVSDLASDPMRRASETAQFIADLLIRSGQVDNEPYAMRSIVGVRFMHSVAAKHLQEEGWEEPILGVPVNQEDVLATALSFSVPVFEMLDVIGVPVDDEDRDAYVRFWLGIGHMLGAPLTDVTTYEEGLALALHIRSRQRARNLSGVRLTEGLMDGVGAGFARGTSWMAKGLMRVIGDPAIVDILMVDQGPGRSRSKIMAGMLRFGFGNRVTRSFTRWAINNAGRKSLEPYFALGSGRPFRRPLQQGEGTAKPVTVIDRDYWP